MLTKIAPTDVDIDSVTRHTKHIWVRMVPDATIAEYTEQPEAWRRIQEDRNLRVGKGDHITLVTTDGSIIYERLPVLRASGGSLWMGKPLRVVRLEVELGLFCSETHQVEPVGTMYGVVERRSGVQESMLYQTEEQAKHAILRRMPKQQVA